jgi:hypothetical protein
MARSWRPGGPATSRNGLAPGGRGPQNERAAACWESGRTVIGGARRWPPEGVRVWCGVAGARRWSSRGHLDRQHHLSYASPRLIMAWGRSLLAEVATRTGEAPEPSAGPLLGHRCRCSRPTTGGDRCGHCGRAWGRRYEGRVGRSVLRGASAGCEEQEHERVGVTHAITVTRQGRTGPAVTRAGASRSVRRRDAHGRVRLVKAEPMRRKTHVRRCVAARRPRSYGVGRREAKFVGQGRQ